MSDRGKRIVVSLIAVAASVLPGIPADAAARIPVCSINQLRVSNAPAISPITGEHATPLRLTNGSRTTCYLRGFPAATLYDDEGRVLPFAYRRSAYLQDLQAHRLVLKPGQSAVSIIDQYRCDFGVDRVAARVALIPPGARRPLTFRFTGAAPTFCKPYGSEKTAAGNTIFLWPLVAARG